ncbi:hypothetical protein COU75_01185 [Candidatus Peregrinibacteria bacterium CG10_big_fil_rev_8_21_14_0_10_42_8]|nr:MAG: hypothetical protein COU75_01185 [Candidatus Peregrinibacteria bacterium CG10_big_fil_rev_8_21_14_0_10_42_8]
MRQSTCSLTKGVLSWTEESSILCPLLALARDVKKGESEPERYVDHANQDLERQCDIAVSQVNPV